MKDSLKVFFDRNPALLYALFFLCGVLIAFGLYSATLFFLFFLALKQKKIFVISTIAFFYVKSFYPLPNQNETGIAEIKIISKKEAKRKGWIYRVKVLSFIPDGKRQSVACNLSCGLYSPDEKKSDRHYLIHGQLIKKRGHRYSLKTDEQWKPLEKKSHSFVDLRYKVKKKVSSYLHTMIPFERAATFLTGLATGELVDSVTLKEFEKRGLNHLLAISGFHFAMIAVALQFLFRPWIPFKWSALFLLMILSLYFLFIGNTPSVARAWMMCIVALCGLLFEKRGSSLNSLGVALLIALIANPLIVFHGGFILSYLATAGLLLFFSPLEKSLRIHLYSGRPKFLRESLAIGISVHLALILYLCLIFHRIPLQGLFYNLFFPLLVTLSLFLLIFGTLFHLCFPLVGIWIHQANGFYTEGILTMLDFKLFPHHTIYIGNISEWWFSIYLVALLFGAIIWRAYCEKKQYEDRLEFCYFHPENTLI